MHTRGRHRPHPDVASRVLQRPATIEKGHVDIPSVPGSGLEWDEEAVRRHEAT